MAPVKWGGHGPHREVEFGVSALWGDSRLDFEPLLEDEVGWSVITPTPSPMPTACAGPTCAVRP